MRETRGLMRCHLLPHFGHIAVTKLTTADIDDVYAHLLRGGGRDDRPLSPGTVHRVHVVLHRALTEAVRWEWIWLNPPLTSPPMVEPADIRPPSVEQVRRLLNVVRVDDIDFFAASAPVWPRATPASANHHLVGSGQPDWNEPCRAAATAPNPDRPPRSLDGWGWSGGPPAGEH